MCVWALTYYTGCRCTRTRFQACLTASLSGQHVQSHLTSNRQRMKMGTVISAQARNRPRTPLKLYCMTSKCIWKFEGIDEIRQDLVFDVKSSVEGAGWG